MKTNLVFKRTVNIEGSSRTEMKIIEVNIPELRSNEGWVLVSSADKVEQVKIGEDKPVPKIGCKSGNDDTTDFLNNLIHTVANASAQSSQEEIEKSATQSAACTIEEKSKIASQIQAESINIANTNIQDNIREDVGSVKRIPKGPIPVTQLEKNIEDASKTIKNKDFSKLKEFESPVPGTACLIRVGETIRISYREGKKANITSPNKICISDRDKQSFFNAVRACNPTSIISKWVLTPKDHHYKYWNEFIDNEYKEQKREYIRIEEYEEK